MKKIHEKDLCYLGISELKNNIDICNSINDQMIKNACYKYAPLENWDIYQDEKDKISP